MINIRVEGLGKVDGVLKDVVRKETAEILTTLQFEIKKRTPIDTGRARKGWRKRTSSVSNTVPYISRLESGYSKQAPRGFTKQAISATLSKRKAK